MSESDDNAIMLKHQQMPMYLAADIVAKFKAQAKAGVPFMQIYKALGEEYGKSPHAIRKLLERFRPKTDLATDFLRAQSVKMARRIVSEGDPGHLIDVLSRSNIGVLAPKAEANSGNTGFMLTVSQDSCGAFKLAAAAGPVPALPAAQTGDEYAQDEGSGEVVPEPRFFGRKSADAIDAARQRLQEARSRQGRQPRAGRSDLIRWGEEDQGLQGPDGHASDS